MRTQLVVLLVLLADLEVFIALEPRIYLINPVWHRESF